MSRQPTWDLALELQADMFQRGQGGGRARRAARLFPRLERMPGVEMGRATPRRSPGSCASVSCEGGLTQIRKVLSHARRESEEGQGQCARLCRRLHGGGRRPALPRSPASSACIGVPVFLFQEGHDAKAERAFKEIARLSRGAHCRFDAGSARQLRELLTAVAVYATGGRKALQDFREATRSDARASPARAARLMALSHGLFSCRLRRSSRSHHPCDGSSLAANPQQACRCGPQGGRRRRSCRAPPSC